MQKVRVIDSDPEELYLVTADELAELQKQSQQAQRDTLLGARWGIKDIISRLSGYNRDSLMKHVLIPNKEHLISIHAVLAWSNDSRGKYLFRATIMAQWLEDNLQKITDGGW